MVSTAAAAVGESDHLMVSQFGPGARSVQGFAAPVDWIVCKDPRSLQTIQRRLELLTGSLVCFPFPGLWPKRLGYSWGFLFVLPEPVGNSRLQASPVPCSGYMEDKKAQGTQKVVVSQVLRILASLPSSFPTFRVLLSLSIE